MKHLVKVVGEFILLLTIVYVGHWVFGTPLEDSYLGVILSGIVVIADKVYQGREV